MVSAGILTYHNNCNKGALLQAYALKQAVADWFEADASVVPYRTASKERQRLVRRLLTKRPHRVPRRLLDHRICESFVESELLDHGHGLITDDYGEAVGWLNAQDYDVVVTGSDEVWKLPRERGGVRGALYPSRPYPNLYFLGEDVAARTVAYAASANTLRLDDLPADRRRRLGRQLSSIDRVSVRDDHTAAVLDRLDVDGVRTTPDPTLLIDLPTEPVESVLRESGVDLDRKVLGLHCEDVDVFERLADHFRDRGYQIVSPTGSRYADVQLRGRVDPFEYYAAYDHFDFVVTSSLHSTIFSLKHRTPFVTVDVADVYRHVESKTRSLLSGFDMLDRHFDATDGDERAVYEAIDDLQRSLDDDHVADRIAERRASGRAFLDTALQEANAPTH